MGCIEALMQHAKATFEGYMYGDIILKPNSNVELADGHVMRISGALDGPNVPEGRLGGYALPDNSYHWSLPRGLQGEILHTRGIEEVVAGGQLNLTNLPCSGVDRELPVRWKHVCFYSDEDAFKKGRRGEQALLALREAECDPNHDTRDPELRNQFRNTTKKGTGYSNRERPADTSVELQGSFHSFLPGRVGAYSPSSGQKRKVEDLSGYSKNKRQRIGSKADRYTVKPQRELGHCFGSSPDRLHCPYTYGDGFCGCGGRARGAAMAGLHVKWAFDHENIMCDSFRANFPGAAVFLRKATAFTENMFYNALVDVMHLSPPCQFFSPAHTRRGKNDEENIRANMELDIVLLKAKPRIVTLENMKGITHEKHRPYLNAILKQFCSVGYSIRWRIIDLRDFGVPQHRERWILIGARPGEPLPAFPRPTHSQYPEQTGLKPWATINQAINAIPEDCEDHKIRRAPH
ncbi:hypothetical protein MMC13_000922 [Lambiella insularis]|nr:hypothetical protein [Lambiella insularis]